MRLAVATLALLAQQCVGFMVPAFPSVSRERGVVCAAEGPAASRGLTRGDAISRAALLIGGAGAAVFGKAAGAFAEGGQRYFDEKYHGNVRSRTRCDPPRVPDYLTSLSCLCCIQCPSTSQTIGNGQTPSLIHPGSQTI
jgi:hypothetical protein